MARAARLGAGAATAARVAAGEARAASVVVAEAMGVVAVDVYAIGGLRTSRIGRIAAAPSVAVAVEMALEPGR